MTPPRRARHLLKQLGTAISGRQALIIPIVTGIYFAAGKLGLMLAFVNASATAVWPPTGIAIATLLIFGRRIWPGILLGAFLVNITTAGTVVTSLAIAVGNTLEGVLGAALVNWFAGGRHACDRPRDIVAFTMLTGLSATVSPLIGVTSISLASFASWASYGSIWVTWWLGDLTGALLVTPLLLLIAESRPVLQHRGQRLEGLLLLLALVVTGEAVFCGGFPSDGQTYPLEFLCIPILIWAAFRFGQLEAAIGTVVLCGIAIWGTLHGFGPFVRPSPNSSLLLLQTFMGVIGVMALVLAAAVRERQQAEAARSRLAAIVEFSEDAIIGKTLEGVIASWNRGAERLYGYTATEIIGKPIAVLVPGERADEIRRILQSIRRGERLEQYETVRARKDGARLDISLTISPIRDESGAVVGASTIARDITARKRAEAALQRAHDELEQRVQERTAELARANDELRNEIVEHQQTEQALRRSESRFRRLVESNIIGVMIADTRGTITEANDIFLQMVGYTRHDLPLRWDAMTPTHYRELDEQAIEILRLHGAILPWEKEYIRKDGNHVPVLLGVAMLEGSQEQFICFALDISQRKQAEKQLRKTNELLVQQQRELLEAIASAKKAHRALQSAQLQLIQAAKLESVGRMAAGVAHEVKNPLATLLIGVEHLMDHFPTDDENVRGLLRDMHYAIRRADGVIKGLLDFSSTRELQLAVGDLNAVIEQSLVLVKHEMDRSHVTLIKQLDSQLPALKLDRTKMEQAFVNLFMNAIHAMPEGGTLTVSTSVGERPTGNGTNGEAKAGIRPARVVTATIDDTGSGIPEDKLSKIYDPFFTTKPTGKGTGLGLTVTKKIIELHEGTITIANRPEGGVRASLLFSMDQGAETDAVIATGAGGALWT